MATSGTIGQVVFTTRKVIDASFRACRISPQVITGEMINNALEQLALMLSEWANVGVPLWCQTKYILPMYKGMYEVPLPLGTVDVLNANLRTVSRLVGNPTSSTGVAANAFDDDLDTVCTLSGLTPQNITLELETGTRITTFGLLPGTTGTLDFELQYSYDASAWTTFYTGTDYASIDEEWLWLDFQGLPDAQYWRIVVDDLSLPYSVRELVWANTPNEIDMARINKDDWFSLPNKTFEGRPVQYWLNRQRDFPIMNLWPAPNSAAQYQQITVLVHRQIMDVGTMTQEVEVPQRAYSALVANLAHRLAITTPEVKIDVVKVTGPEASRSLNLFWGEERDRSPINIELDIGPYTR